MKLILSYMVAMTLVILPDSCKINYSHSLVNHYNLINNTKIAVYFVVENYRITEIYRYKYYHSICIYT